VCDEFRAKNAKIATRQASGNVLDALVPVVPELIGGSADLTPSNNTKAKAKRTSSRVIMPAAMFAMAYVSTRWRRR
jgi:transketolase